MNKVWLVAKETYKRNTLNWSFLFMLLFPLLAVVFSIAVGYFTSNMEIDTEVSSENITVVADAPTEEALQNLIDQSGTEDLDIDYVTDEQDAKATDNDYLKLEVADDALKGTYYAASEERQFSEEYPMFSELLNNYQVMLTLNRLDLTPEDYEQLTATEVPIDTVALAPSDNTASDSKSDNVIAFGITFFMVFVVFMYIAVYANLIIQSIADEKGSRIMEILLSTMTATQNFYGKLLGILMMIFTQIAVYALFGVGVFLYFKDTIQALLAAIPGDVWNGIGTALLWPAVYGIFGIVLYSVLAAFIGSLATKKEDAQKAAGPLSILQLIGFYLGIFGMTNFPEATFLKVTSHIPLFAPSVMPFRIAFDQVDTPELIISLAVNVLFILLVLKISTTFYKTNVLSYSDEGVWKTFKRSLTLNRGEHKNK